MDFSDLTETPATEPDKKPYWQVLHEYRQAQDQFPDLKDMSLPDFSDQMSQATGKDYSEGKNDSTIRRLGVNPSVALHHFGGAEPGTWPSSWPTASEAFGGPREGIDLPKLAGGAAERGATALGAPESVAKPIGTGAEQLVESAPAAAAGTALGIPGLAGMSALETYGETGSKLQAGISGVGGALIPKFMEGAGQTALRTLGAKTLGELKPELGKLLPEGAEALRRFAPSSLVERGVEFGAKQAGLTANILGTQAAETSVDPNLSWQDKLKNIGSEFSPSSLIATGVGQLPFTAMDLVHARTHPLDLATQGVRADFADRFSKEYQKGTGTVPTAKEVQSTIDRLETGKTIPPESPTAQVLASMGQAPIEADLKTPIHTSEGDMNPIEAIESTRTKANRMLMAQGMADPDNPPITTAHDPTLAFVLRGIDAKTLSKDDLTHLAASKVTDLWAGDRADLKQSGFVPEGEFPPYGQGTDPERRFISYQLQSGVDERIAALTDPESKLYDPNVAQRIALVSGDQEHWLQAGIPEGLQKNVWQAVRQAAAEVAPELQVTKEEATAKPLLTNIINLVSGLGPKRAERVAAIEQQIQAEIAQHGIFDVENGEGVLHDRLQTLYGELQRVNASKWERSGLSTGRENVGAPLGDATFAARRRALMYDKPFDINDPKSIADFVRDISATIRQAEKNFARRQIGEPAVKDAKGDALRFASKDLAEEYANDANSRRTGSDQYNVKYVVPDLPEKDGTFRVLEKRFVSLFGMPEVEQEFERPPEGLEPEEDTTEKPLAEENVVPEGTTFDALSEASNMFSRRIDELNKHNDPAVREGRKAAMVKNFSDFMQAIPDATFREIWKARHGTSVREIDNWKKRFIRFVQFLGYNGNVVIKQEGGRLTGIGDLDKLNQFMQELGYGKYPATHKQAGEERSSDYNRVRADGTNFFEKFALLSNFMSRFVVDPRSMAPDPEHKPTGDYGWLTPEFRRDIDKKVAVNWTDLPKSDVTHFRPGVFNRDGTEYRSDLAGVTDKTGTIKVSTGQPLADLIISSTKHDLVTKAQDVVKWFGQLGGIDPQQVALAQELFKRLPFVANQNVGFSITKDPLNRGYYHTDNTISSAGVLVDPYVYNAKTGKLELMHPRDIFPHLIHELGHSTVDFAWHTDAAFKADVQRTYDYVKEHLDSLVSIGAAGEKFAQLGLTSLRNPQEMLAGMFNDPTLHEFLKGVDDPEPFYQSGVRRSFFDRVYNMIKDLFTKLVGPVGANTMLARVANLVARGVDIQTGMKLVNRGDIYQELYRRGLLAGEEITTPKPEAVPKPVEPTQVYPPHTPQEVEPERPGTLPNDLDPVRRLLEQEVEQARMNVSYSQWDPYSPQGGDLEIAQKRLRSAQDKLDRFDRGELPVTEVADSSAVRDRESYVADLQAQLIHTQGLQLSDPAARAQQVETIARLTNEIKLNNELIGQLNKLQSVPEGQVLQSRTDPSRVIDAMKAASVYLTEDNAGDLWFKPFDVKRFRDTFGPAFGDKLRLTENGGQWGYSIQPSEAFNLTEGDVARMPVPRVRSWAPSIFETMKSLFKQQGANDQTAEALAGYNMQFAALLKNSERGIWGVLPVEGNAAEGYTLGRAWGYIKQAGITGTAAEHEPDITVRHESAHMSGFHDSYQHETPDVQRAVGAVNKMYEGLSQDQRTALIETLTNLTNEDRVAFRAPYSAAIADPFEFAADIMGHVGDMLTEVPKPSAYLRETMRFAPDEISRLLQLTTLRRTQGLDRLALVLGNTEKSRGLKQGQLFDTIKRVSDSFNDMARSALDIAEDQSEFYRARMVYPDTYKGLLQQVFNRQQSIMEGTKAAGYEGTTPRLQSELLESRLPPTIENMVRKFFNYPTSDGNLPTKLPLWDRNMMQFAQFALKYPMARSFVDMFMHSDEMKKTFRLRGQVALAGALQGDRVFDDVRTKQVSQFSKSIPMRNKLSQIALELDVMGDFKYNEEKKAAGGDEMAMDPTKLTGWVTPQLIRGLMDKHGVTDAERPAIQTVLDGLRNQYIHTFGAIVGDHQHALETMLAMGVTRNTDLQPEAARSAAKMLIEAVQKQTTDTNAAVNALAQFQQIVTDPAVFQRLVDAAQNGWQDIQRLDRSFQMRSPYYFSEMRPGKYNLVWKDADGKTRTRPFASAKEREKFVTSNNIKPVRQTNPDTGIGINPNLMGIIDEIRQRTIERAKNLFGEEDAEQLGRLTDFATDLRDSLNQNDLLKETLGRRLEPGRDELDMFATTQHYLRAVSNSIMKRFVRRESELLFTSPEFANEPNIKAYIKGHIEAFMKPDTPTGGFMRNLAFFYYLWGNPSSMIMQTSHQVMGLAPMLTRQGQSVASSFNIIRKANQAVIESKKGGYKDPVVRDMVDRLKKDLGISSWVSRETDYNPDLSIINRIRGTSGKPLWGPFDLLKNKAYQAMDLGRRMYDVIPRYNSEVAFVASVMHLMSRKAEFGGPLSGDELYNEAKFLRQNTMYTGGKENRPGFFQWMPRSAAQGLWSLQTYANGLTTEMGELIRRSFNPKGMTPAQTRQVRKAAAQMLITQTAVSGVLGLPFATLTLTALQKLFPEHNVEQDIRDALASLAGDDEALGGLVSNIGTMGIPSAMDYSPDLGSRFALHGVFHVSPYGDIGWEQLFGPTGGILQNAVKGAQAGLEGNPIKTVQSMMPVGFQRVWQSLEQGQTYKTQSGRIMANDLGPSEIVARMIGFRPARVRRIEDFERLNKVTESAAQEEQTNWTKKQVELLKAGDDRRVQQNIAQRVADKKVYPAQKLANDVAQEYERQTTPVDLRKFGNRATIMAQKNLKGVLGTQSEGPTNLDRLSLQQQIAARLGMGGPSHNRFRHAAGVDQLLQMYPNLTTSQASLLLNRARSSRPTPDLYQELLANGE